MRRLLVWFAIVGVVGLLLPATAGAQGGSISGLVEDSTGGILPGVTIEADSPVNIEGTLTAFTDSAGRFTIINLRPGTYTVTFTLPGFNTFIREGIIMSGDATVQVSAELAVGTLEETVTVSGASPVVDVQQVRRQFVATRAMMDVLPAARTMEARALLIPGVRNAGMGEGLYWTTVHGSTTRDSQTMNDGMRANSTVDDGQFRMGWEMSDAATAELTFEAGGAPAEVQVGGVIQNAIPKEGGNTFSGTWFTYYGSGAMGNDNASPELRALLGEVNKLDYDIDTNPAFGGKLIQDKLWFFAAFRTSDRKDFAAGTFFGDPTTGACRPVAINCSFQPDAEEYFGKGAAPGTQAFNRTYGHTGVLRLTNQLSDRHKWRLGFERLNRQHPLQNVDQTRPPESADAIVQPTGYHSQARWTSSLSNRLLVEAGFSVQYNKWRREQFPWNKDNSSTFDLGTGTWGGGFWITGWQPEKSRHFKTSMSYVTGSHNFKLGMEHRWGNLGLDQPMANDVRTYYYFDGARSASRCWDAGDHGGELRWGVRSQDQLRHGDLRAGLVDPRQLDAESGDAGRHLQLGDAAPGRTGGHVGAGSHVPGLSRPALEHHRGAARRGVRRVRRWSNRAEGDDASIRLLGVDAARPPAQPAVVRVLVVGRSGVPLMERSRRERVGPSARRADPV